MHAVLRAVRDDGYNIVAGGQCGVQVGRRGRERLAMKGAARELNIVHRRKGVIGVEVERQGVAELLLQKVFKQELEQVVR